MLREHPLFSKRTSPIKPQSASLSVFVTVVCMTMSHHITPSGAAHDVKPSVAPALVSFSSLETGINVLHPGEDTTDNVNPFAPAPSCSRGAVKTPSIRAIRKSKRRCPYRQASLCAKVSLSALSAQDRAASSSFFFVACKENTINKSKDS